jgi:hypothetical protein
MINLITPFSNFSTDNNDGLHRTISRAVYRLCLLTGDDDYILGKLKPLAEANTKRTLQPREVENLIIMHREKLSSPVTLEKQRRKPPKNEVFTRTIATKANLATLRHHTGMLPMDPTESLNRLYAKSDWLFIGKETYNVQPKTVEGWTDLDLSNHSMIMPNPFEPDPPARKGEFVRERLYTIYESDEPWMTHDMQAGVIMHLKKQMPLRMVVSSGNSSLHAWFDVSFATHRAFEEFEDTCHLLCEPFSPVTMGHPSKN